jgi:E3 ubiquitin-protein ligase RNF5
MIAGYGLFPSLFNLVFIKDGDIEKDERHESILSINLDEAMVEV